jgi:alcohol dehydrogenase
MGPFDFHPRTRVIFSPGAVARLGSLAGELGCRRPLVVSDPGIVAGGIADIAIKALRVSGMEPVLFHDFDANPDERMVEEGRVVGAANGVDGIIAVGGGSSLDCAKGVNFVLTSGGRMRDYRGYGKANAPMLPMIGVPTTAGTGSEAQSYALISHSDTHVKMACGDPGAAFRVAVLDPELTVSQPWNVTATSGYDALSHAVEAFVTSKRTVLSDMFAREAWRLLQPNFERVLGDPSNVEARAAMLVGSYHAGLAIEQSMLGATHACANPLTARFGTTHGVAIAVMLPHVVRWNGERVGERYAALLDAAGITRSGAPGDQLADLLEALARAGGLPATLRELGVPREDLPVLAADASPQWTGTFNPRAFDASAAERLYELAF